jgi:hypothetical protein
MREAARARNEALDLTRPSSKEYLVRALGGEDWVTELEGVPRAERTEVFLELFLRRLLASGAQHLLTIPIRNVDGAYVYTLVHASKSLKGFTVMKEAVSSGLRSGTLPQGICDQIRRDLSASVPVTIAALEQRFAGQTVRWTLPRGGKGDSVRRFVLETTPIFDFQLEELQEALVNRGLIPLGKTGKPRMPILVTFA